MDKLHNLSLPDVWMKPVMRALIALSLIVFVTVLYIVVKRVSSPLKPDSGRDLSMVNTIYGAEVTKKR